jgi:hypothetical protein
MSAFRGRRLAAVAVVLAVWLATGRRAAAHALGAECKLVGDRVEVEAFYDDDTPAREARVSVRDGHKQAIAEGRTDSQGRWSFARPAAGTYEVVVEAGGGHRAQVQITIPEADAGTPAAPETISTGPTREEFTRFPWPKVALGLAAIGVFSLALWVVRRRR